MARKRETEMQELPCKLTADELNDETQKLVQAEQELARLKAEKKAKVAELNAQLKQTDAEIAERVKVLSTGERKRIVEVEKRYRFEDDCVDWVRLDTNEVVQTLPMDAFDRQEALELDGQDQELPPPAVTKPRKPRKKRGELSDVPDEGVSAEAN